MNEYLPSAKTIVRLALGLIILNAVASFFPLLDRVIYYPVDTVKSFFPSKS